MGKYIHFYIYFYIEKTSPNVPVFQQNISFPMSFEVGILWIFAKNCNSATYCVLTLEIKVKKDIKDYPLKNKNQMEA